MPKCLVILSGGQDSTTCLAIASQQFDEVHAVTFEYGQRHAIELESADAVARTLSVTSHEVIKLGAILKGTSPLVSKYPVSTYTTPDEVPDGVAATFVPSRNALFLTIASNRAIALECSTIFTGVSQTDYSGYPDCRRDFIDSLEETLSLANWGTIGHLKIETPLMYLSKAESVLLAKAVLGDRFEEVMELTHTCYQGVKGGCGKCAACLLRDQGFKEANVVDPIWKFRG
ncbi:7-cyano-7-deazaguanine synthase [Chlorogloeopsis fritschii PCC 6912]|uniref:7-cyano-7-deazaguanine synthase n=1 Tax=Chlorogloeopsis fritschii PCC 6912 TaxID=211165 RepID=A0A433N6D6_CHLFR|nr:7-cyano-7-deazaguanine synthase QueC [Chlorogloeopsis fritschii]RUR77037.1 7-cyano-7-deazaguanine synthase [Chlorogloeopsis fritschii PCC 6912]